MGNLRFIVLLALAGGLAATGSFAADDPAELHILKARIDFGRRPGTDRLELKAAFDPGLLTAGRTPANSELTVTTGPETVISLPPLDERMRLRSKKDRIWRLRVKATREHRDSLKLKLDIERGKLRLSGERLDLRDVRATGASDVTFTLTVGGATFSQTIELGEKENRWRYRYTGPAFVPSDPGGTAPPIDPGPPDDSVTFRMLTAPNSQETFGNRTVVLRTEEDFAREWAKYAVPVERGSPEPLPSVDFSMEIVILIEFGFQYLGGAYMADVKSVTELGDGLSVRWRAWNSGGCPVPGIPEPTFMFFAVTRRDGPVTFTKESHTQQCF